MKKTVALMAVFGCSLGVWAGDTSYVAGANVLGYSEVKSKAAYLPLAISYDAAAGRKGVEISAADVVLTAPLTVGDELYVYDRKLKTFNSYTLQTNATESAKEWVANEKVEITVGGTSEATSAPAGVARIAAGYGLWLHRLGESTNCVVQVMGQIADSIKVTVNPGEAVLLGVPAEYGKGGLDLDSTDLPFSGKEAKNDLIQIPQPNGSLLMYRYNGTAWTLAVRGTTKQVIPVGSAFWYLRKGGTTLEFDWVQ